MEADKAIVADDPPPPDLTVYEKHFIFPFTNYTKKKMKDFRIPARKNGYLMVCVVCPSGMADIMAVEQHVSGKQHKLRLKEHHLDQALSQPPTLTVTNLDALTSFIESTYQAHSAAACGQLAVRRDVVEVLQGLVHDKFPDVSVEMHGSTASEFAVINSNVNINLDIPAAVDSQKAIPAVMNGVLEILKSNAALYTDVRSDYYAFNKIPRILFKHKKSGLLCEIRPMAGNPMVLAQLLKCYGGMDERVFKLGVVFLHWVKICKLDVQEYGYYPGHMFIVMVIHFLQQTTPPVVPVLHEMIPPRSREGEEEGVGLLTEDDLSLFTTLGQEWRPQNRQSLGELWIQLLRFYTHDFDVPKLAVSIRQKDPLLRETRQWGIHRLAVEDPMITKNNLARCGYYDRVYDYYITCLKQTTVYFYSQLPDKGPGLPSISSPPHTPTGLQDDDCSVVLAISPSSLTTPPGTSAEPPTPPKETMTPVQKDEVASLTCALEDLSISVVDIPKKSVDTEAQSAESVSCSTSPCKSKTKSTATVVKFRLSRSNCVLQPYQKVCSVCRNSAKHTYEECPNEMLPNISSSLSTPPPKTNSLNALRDTFKAYMKDVAPSQRDKKERKNVCDFIVKDIHNIYPEAQLQLFGSSANGFGLYTSDVDMCLILPGNQPTEALAEKTHHKDVIAKVGRELRKYVEYERVVPITSARVPIVKFFLPNWNLECDISMENRLAMRNTAMLKAYSTIDDRVRVLGYMVKKFAKVCDIGDASSGSLSSYAYILLMLHYLQNIDPPVVPILQQLHPTVRTEGPIINGWDCYYYQFDNPTELKAVWSGWKKNTQNVGELWLGFLRHMLTFNWNEYVVTIRQQEPLCKFDKWWIGKPLCIEDPFNLEHNLGCNVSGKMRSYILERFQAGLVFHSKNFQWQHIDAMMDDRALVGDCKAPKFLICHFCNVRGHRQSQCPVKAEVRRPQPKNRHKRAPPPHQDHPPPPSRAHTYPQQGVPYTARPLLPPPHLIPGPYPSPGQPMGMQQRPRQPSRMQQPRQPMGMQQPRGQPIRIMQRPPGQPIGMQQGYPPQYQHMYPPSSGYYMQGPPASLPHSATPTPPMYPSPRPTPPTYVGSPPASQGIPPGSQHYHGSSK